MPLGNEFEDDVYTVGAATDDEPDSPKGPTFVLTEELEDSENLIPELMKTEDGKRRLRGLVDDCYVDFEDAWESTEQYRARRGENQKLFKGLLPMKHRPFKDAANIHIPLALENLTRITFRVKGEIFHDWRNVFTVEPVGPDDVDKAMTLTKHGNWQIRYQLPEFTRQMSRGILQFFADGDVVTHSWWDDARKRNCHEVLTCDDFVIPFVHLTVMPDLSDVPYKCKIMQMYRHDLQRNRETWVNIDKVIERKLSDLDDDPETLLRDATAKAQGIEKPGSMRSAPHKVIWYEGWTDAFTTDPQTERDRHVQVIFDYNSKIPLCVRIHELANWQEKLRYERESQELVDYRTASQQHSELIASLPQRAAAFEQDVQNSIMQGQPPPEPAQLEQLRTQFRPEAFPAPTAPAWTMELQQDLPEGEVLDYGKLEPRRPRKEPINTFAHAVCIEPMLGNLGIGFGDIQSDLNRATNILMSQTVDQASLSNAQSFVTAGEIFKKPFMHGPGNVNIAQVSPTQLKDSILPIQPGQANPQLFEIMNMLASVAQSSASAQEVLSGAPGKSGETARGLQQRIEQANTQLSTPTRDFADNCLGQVLKNNALLNSFYMLEEEVFNIVNHYRGPEQIQLGRQMYERDYRVVFGADLRFAGRAQRVAEADEITAMVNAHPAMVGNLAFFHRALANSLRARGMEELIPYLGQEPPMTGLQMPQAPPQQAQAQAA